MRITGSLVVALGLLAVGSAGPARATFPGANEHLAWTSLVDSGTSAARTAVFLDTLPISNPLPDENHSDPSFSPDGSKLVFISHSPSYGWRIERINPNGTGRQVVVNVTQVGRGTPFSPVWTKDGRRVVFRAGPCNGNVTYCTYSINADGTGGLIEGATFGVGDSIDLSSKGHLTYRFVQPLQPEPDVL